MCSRCWGCRAGSRACPREAGISCSVEPGTEKLGIREETFPSVKVSCNWLKVCPLGRLYEGSEPSVSVKGLNRFQLRRAQLSESTALSHNLMERFPKNILASETPQRKGNEERRHSARLSDQSSLSQATYTVQKVNDKTVKKLRATVSPTQCGPGSVRSIWDRRSL